MFPFEDEFLAEAEATRGRIIAAGIEDIRALEEECSRARFFALPGVYRACE